MNKPEILGIYGGTFSPPHLGHRKAAETFLNALSPDQLLVIPTFLPPHKTFTEADSPEHRLEMCRLTFGDLPNTEVSDLEIRRQGKSYTYDTLAELTQDGREIYFLCGTDMLLTLDRWYRARDLFSLATFVLERREQDPSLDDTINERIAHYKKEYGARIVEISIDPILISSTDVRSAAASEDSRGLLPTMVTDKVAAYIEQHRLYREKAT